MTLARRTLLLLALATGACLTRSLPIPPPSAVVQAVTVCEPAVCPGGGVSVSLTGTAIPGALVIVEDTNPETLGPVGEALVAAARVLPDGSWRALLAPQHDGVRVRAPRRGDVLNVYQVTPAGETSQSRFIEVPRSP